MLDSSNVEQDQFILTLVLFFSFLFLYYPCFFFLFECPHAAEDAGLLPGCKMYYANYVGVVFFSSRELLGGEES